MNNYDKERMHQNYEGDMSHSEYFQNLLLNEGINDESKAHLIHMACGYEIDTTPSYQMYLGKNYYPNLAVLGATGAGKTAAVNNILHGVSLQEESKNIETYLFDCKGVEFQDYKNTGLKKVKRYADNVDDMMSSVYELSSVLTARCRLCDENKVQSIEKYNKNKRAENKEKGLELTQDTQPIIFVVVDEYDALEYMLSKEEYNLFMRKFENLLRLGRLVSIFICLSSQTLTSPRQILVHGYCNNYLVLRVGDSVYSEFIGDWNEQYKRPEKAGWGIVKNRETIHTVAIPFKASTL